MKKLDTLVEDFKRAQEEFSVKAKATLKESVLELIQNTPEIESIRWNQYTPYFNDGDECVFRVGEPEFKVKGAPEGAGDYGDGYQSLWDLNYTYRKENNIENRDTQNPIITEDMRSFVKLVQSNELEDLLRSMFGNHKEIVIDRDGNVEISDYDHE